MQRGFRQFRPRFRRLLAFVGDSFNRFFGGLKPRKRDYGSQRMCPFCGLITPRYKTSCLECGHTLKEVPAG